MCNVTHVTFKIWESDVCWLVGMIQFSVENNVLQSCRKVQCNGDGTDWWYGGIRNYKGMQGIICRWYVAVSIFLASILHTSIPVSYFLLRFYSVPHTHTQAIAYCLTLAPKGSFFRFWFYTCRPAKHPPTFHAIFNSTSNTHPLLIEVTDSIPPMLPVMSCYLPIIYLSAFFNGRFIYYW